HRGFAADQDVDGMVVLSATGAPAIQALETREAVEVAPNAGARATGLCGDPISRALALPIVAGSRVIAVAYVENAAGSKKHEFEIGRKIAGILIEIASRRVGAKKTLKDDPGPAKAAGASGPRAVVDASSSAGFSPQRQARRVKMRDVVNI